MSILVNTFVGECIEKSFTLLLLVVVTPMELEATLSAMGLDEVEGPGRVEDGGLQDVEFSTDADVDLLRDLFAESLHAGFG